MAYLRWIVIAVQIVAVGLIFAAFIPLQPRTENERQTFYFRPWFLVYGVVVFIIWSLLDIVVTMNFLE